MNNRLLTEIEPETNRLDKVKIRLPRIALAVAFIYIGRTKFSNDPHSQWIPISTRSVGVSGFATSPA